MIEANKSFKVAVNRFAGAGEEAAMVNGYTIHDVDVIIPHQANLRIIQGMAKKLNVPIEKVYMTIEKYGNISSATVPIALDEAVRDGTITKRYTCTSDGLRRRPYLGKQSHQMVMHVRVVINFKFEI